MPFVYYLADIAACLRRLTWLPLPLGAAEDERPFQEACWAYPVAGAAIGGAAAITFLAADGLGLPSEIASVLAVAVSIAVTGAGPERALAGAAAALAPGGEQDRKDAPFAAKRTAVVLVLAILLRAGAVAAAAAAAGDAAAAGGILIAAAAISLPTAPWGWLAAVLVAGAATGGIVFAAHRRERPAGPALPAVLAPAEILALLAIAASG